MSRAAGPPLLVALSVLLVSSLLSARTEAQGVCPIRPTAFQLDYELLYHDAIAAQDLKLLPATGPIGVSSLARERSDLELNPAPRLFTRVGDDRVRFFTMATERLRGQRDLTSDDIFSGIAGVCYEMTDRLGAVVMFQMDRERALDPTYTGKKWRGLAGELETAALYYDTDGLTLTLGRQRVYWGPRPTNLVLSAEARPLDLISADFGRGRLGLHFLFARLDQSRPDSVDIARFPDYDFSADNRYLVGHRLDIRLHRTLRLGLFEMSVFGGAGRSPELYYLNPLQFFHGAQLNEGDNDNTLLGLDFTWLPRPGWNLYGQLLIDDYQIDDQAQGDQEPDEIGFMAGLTRTGRVSSLRPDITLEYVRIANRTYQQLHARNRYIHRNQPLGHPLGPDADSVSLALQWWPNRRQAVSIELAYARHGEGSLYAPWTEPWLEADGDYSEPFPTGVVQKSLGLQIAWRGYLPLMEYTSNHLFATVEAGYADFENRHNIRGCEGSDAWFDLSLTWLGFAELAVGD